MDKFTNNDWQSFEIGKLVINCKTEELAKNLFKVLDSKGYKWTTDESLLSKFVWDNNKTCYRTSDKKISYGPISMYDDGSFGVEIVKSWEEQITYTRQEIINEFYKNPDTKVQMIKTYEGNTLYEPLNITLFNGEICTDHSIRLSLLIGMSDKSEFIILPKKEKKLKEMSFWEAFSLVDSTMTLEFFEGKCAYKEVIYTLEDLIDNRIAHYSIRLILLRSKWTIEGVFEDE